MTDPHVSHGRPSPRTLEEAIRETQAYLDTYMPGPTDKLILRNQISMMEAIRAMHFMQWEPR